MKRYDLLTPEGTRDLLFEECIARRKVEEKLHKLFGGYGYSEVITPGIEFYDVFYSKKRYLSPENMYKLTDSNGRLIVIRPDSTLPIARLVGTRLKGERLPLKLYYSQNIFRVNPKNSGRDDEITQSGIEIIGGETYFSDFEALSLASEVLKSVDVSDFHIEIGDCGFFKDLIGELGLSRGYSEDIRVLIESKNYPELERALKPYESVKASKALTELPKLFGGREVFDKAREIFFVNKKLSDLLDGLNLLYDNLADLYGEKFVGVDLGMVNKINYYTGILFRGYVEGFGTPIISGGRYDTLLSDYGENLSAIGFAVNVNSAAKILLSKTSFKQNPDVLLFCETKNMKDCISRANELIAKGHTIELSLYGDIEEAREYVKSKGIGRLEVIK
ncbi:MAG: ATP phosphoribosyltransferase regulatory subunit [Eubacterium sp.]|jgi:ATP phosphoribosyltransferase regulatory subunit|nr:ATP phosphoribosyltransferase regulatory subunit [Eubacterium sp.]